MAELDLCDLKRVIDTIFEHIRNDLKIDKLTIRDDQDFYWDVPSNDLYSVKETQPQLEVGRLVDDLEFLQAILKDKDQAVALMLIHAAPLLRHIGQEIGQ
jgi:hypothetical protein